MNKLQYRNGFLDAGSQHQERFNSVDLMFADALTLGVLITDIQGHCVYSNKVYQTLCGWTSEELNGACWSSMIHPQDHASVIGQWEESLFTKTPFQCEARLKGANGEDVWTRMRVCAMHEGMPGHVYVHTVEDISAQKALEATRVAIEERLDEDRAREQVMLNVVCDALICTDTDGQITYLNRAAESLTGFTGQAAIGRPLSEIYRVLEAGTREIRPDIARQAVDCNVSIGLHNNTLLVNRSGQELAIEDSATPIHNRKNEVVGAVIMFHDSRYSSETTAKMVHLAHHDPLTGLFNRHGFFDRFDQSLELARRHGKQMGMLFIDLDEFKGVNDVFGHDMGDRVLKKLADALQSCVRASDTVCRYGGDEFVVLLNEVAEPGHVFAVADKVFEAAASAFAFLEHKQTSLKLSVGLSVYPDNGETLEALLHHADAEMYRMKMSGKQPRKRKTFHAISGQQPLA